jgi:uncharacterized cupin superfamily protein
VQVTAPGNPCHKHHVIDELFYIRSCSGEYRMDDRSLPLRAGDLVAAPAATEAHQIINRSAAEPRFLAFSTSGAGDIVEYPDGGKVGVSAGMKNAVFKTANFKALGAERAS